MTTFHQRRLSGFLVLMASVFALSSCSAGADPVAFNDKMINIQMDIAAKMKSFGDDVGSAAKVVVADENKKLDELSKLIDTDIATVKALPVPTGGEDFHAAMLGIFGYYHQVTNGELKQLMEILAKGEAMTDADLAAIKDIQAKINTDEGAWDKKVKDAQQAFADKNNIQIQY